MRASATIKRWLPLVFVVAGCTDAGDRELSRAAADIQQGDLRAALIRTEKILQRQPDNLEARLLRAEALLRQGGPSGLREELLQIEEAGADPARVRLLRYQLDAFEGNFETLLDEVESDVGVVAENARTRWRATSLAALGRWESATTLYRDWLARDPQADEARIGLVELLARTGRVEEAISLLDEVPDSARDFQFWFLKAFVNSERRDYSTAADDLAKASTLTTAEDQKLAALLAIVRNRLDVGDFNAAGQAAERLGEAFPNVPATSLVRARVAFAQGKYELAAYFIRDYRVSRPDDADAVVFLAATRVQNGQLAEAKRHIEDVLAEHPEHPTAARLLSDIEFREAIGRAASAGRLGRTEDAAQIYRAMLDRWPENPLVLNNLAWLLYEAKDGSALSYAERAYERAPDVPQIADTYGWLLVESGRLEEGEAILAKAAPMAAESEAIRAHLREAQARLARK